jgi:hypothetical protein
MTLRASRNALLTTSELSQTYSIPMGIGVFGDKMPDESIKEHFINK